MNNVIPFAAWALENPIVEDDPEAPGTRLSPIDIQYTNYLAYLDHHISQLLEARTNFADQLKGIWEHEVKNFNFITTGDPYKPHVTDFRAAEHIDTNFKKFTEQDSSTQKK